MKKIVWVASGPNNIYLNFFDGLKEIQDDFEPVLIVGKERNEDPNRVKYNRDTKFEIIELEKQQPLINYLFCAPLVIKNFFKRLPIDTDMPTMINLKGLYKTLEEEQPDAIISTTHFKPYSSIVHKYCANKEILFILQSEVKGHPDGVLMGLLSRISVLLKRRMFNGTDRIYTWSKKSMEHHQDYPLDPEKVRKVTPGFDQEKFCPCKVETDEKYIDILLISRLVPFKRPLDVLEALKYLKEVKGIHMFRVNILGSGPLFAVISKYVEKHNLQDNVRFHEKVPQEKLKELYCKHDMFILPSHNEELGMVVIEAMACGLPVIVSDTAGAATYVKDGESGIIYESKNVKELADAIMGLQLQETRDEYSKNAIDQSKKYTIKQTATVLYYQLAELFPEIQPSIKGEKK